MHSSHIEPQGVSVSVGDLDALAFDGAQRAGRVAFDIETTGLDWRSNRICTCQLYVPGYGIAVVQIPQNHLPPPRLCNLIEDRSLCKVFHFAMFDLAFIVSSWCVKPRNVRCTKIASRILDSNSRHTLEGLLAQHLGIKINKSSSSPRQSDWQRDELTLEQVLYAANDVRYLLSLLDKLESDLKKKQAYKLARHCWAFLPERVAMEVRGIGDPFRY